MERAPGTTTLLACNAELLAWNASHPREERRWFYAIHRPTRLQNIYTVSVGERPLLDLGAIHQGFHDVEQAWYFMVHGHVRDNRPPLCVWCQEESQYGSAEEGLLVVQMEKFIRIRNECTETVEFEKIDRSVSVEPGEGFGQYYAVAKGRIPGIYNDWDEAKKQVEGFSCNEYQKFRSRASAVRYLRSRGLPDGQIRLFRKTFTSQPNFTPNPKAEFKKEFKRLASSQQWTAPQARRARVDAIRDEIIQHFLPDGIRISEDQDDDEGYTNLDDDQTLEIYLAMCRKAGKVIRDRPDQDVSDRIDLCLMALKDKPYVNILDFVDTYRTGRPVRTFGGWNEFKKYTLHGRRMDVMVAKENEFLAPLLQDFCGGPMSVDPRRTRRQFVTERAETLRQRKLALQESGSVTSSLEFSRESSPSVTDQDEDMSPPNSPIRMSAPPSHIPQRSPDSCDAAQVDFEPTTSVSSGSVVEQLQPLTHMMDYDPLPGHEIPTIEGAASTLAPTILPLTDITWMDSVHKATTSRPTTEVIDLTQDDEPNRRSGPFAKPARKASSLGKRPRASSPRVMVPAKRACSGMRKDFAFYPELPLAQGDIRNFFRPCTIRV